MTNLLRERYEPVEVVGQGGEGRVLRAVDHQHDRVVALKVRQVASRADRAALLAEARILLGVPPHPHVPLVREDFFEGDRYVIAMDWIEGTDLSHLLRARGAPGLPAASVLGWLTDAAHALDFLHRLEPPVIHGDVKPANLVLAADGRVVLVDFGLSSSPHDRRRRAGTSGFSAPELAAGEPPTPAGDVYALAATAFALLTGEAPTGIRPIWDGVDPAQAAALEDAIRTGLATDPARRPPTAGELMRRLWASVPCPYPGLPAYEPEDAGRFFGREAVVRDLRGHVDEHGFVALVGASGSGKSSVLRAGLVAQVPGDVTVVTPGPTPAPLDEGEALVVVDQLEEAFSLCDDVGARRAFLDSIAERSGPVAVGIRADFYGRCAEHPALAVAMAADQVLLGPLSREELGEAIVEPAERAGLQVEPALVDLLVDEVSGEPGALPLLSHALRSTWERRDGPTLTVDAYRATGGLRAAIATTAEAVYGGLDPADQGLARRTFLALTEPGEGTEDSRRWATLAELTPPGGAARVEALLEAMATERLVSRGDGTVAVAHEALIREWPRLRAWLDEDRDGLRLHRHLAATASAWDGLGRESAELYRGPRLAAALDWAARSEDLSTLEEEFLEASVVDQERAVRGQLRANRRLRGLLAGVGVALVVALVAALLAVRQQDQAQEARNRADVSRVAAVSRSLVDTQPDVGLLLAATAYDLDDTADTRGTLLSALEAHPLLGGLIYGVDSGLEAAAFSPDGRVLATPTSDGTGTLLWDTTTHARVATLDHGDDGALDAAISPDGSTLVVPSGYVTEDGLPAGRLQVWDVASRRLLHVVDSPAGILTTAAFTPDGSRLITQGGLQDSDEPPDVAVVWDAATWRPVGRPWVIDPSYSGDRALAVSPDGRLVALPLPDGATVGVYRLADRAPVGEPIDVGALTGADEGLITRVTFGADGGQVLIATELGTVAFVDARTGALDHTLPLPESAANALAVSPDGDTLAVGRIDGRTQLYDLATSEPAGPSLAASASTITDVAFSDDGAQLATTSADRTGGLWRLDGGRAIGVPLTGQDGPVTEAAYTADGDHLLTASLDGTVAIRAADGGRVERRVRVPGEVLSVAVAPSGRRAAASGNGGAAVLFDVDGGNRVDVDLGEGWGHQTAFSPDGSTVVIALDQSAGGNGAGPGSGRVRFVDAATGRDDGEPIELEEPAIGVRWSPDGATLAVVAQNNLVHLFDARSRHEVGDPIENVDAMIAAVAFRPDGRRLAIGVGSGDVRQYDVTTHEPVGDALVGAPGGVFGVAYSPDGLLLAGTTLGLSTTNLWDAESGAPLGEALTGGRAPYTFRTFTVEHLMAARPAFSPDGRHLATAGWDGASVVWDLDPGAWRAAACHLAGRDLTDAEWARYLPGASPRRVCGG